MFRPLHLSILLSLLLLQMIGAHAEAATSIRAEPPANDDFANARPVVFNTTHTVKNVHLATKEAGEPVEHCLTAYSKSVWFTFVAPFSGAVAFSTAGSWFTSDSGTFGFSAPIVVYSGTALNALTPVECATSMMPIVLPSVNIVEGTTYYIAVLVSSAVASPSTLKFKSSIVSTNFGTYDLGLVNPSFESPLGVGWNLKNATNGDFRECFSDPFVGQCAIKLIGGPNEATALKQTLPWPSNVLVPRVGDVITLSGFVKAVAPANLTVALKIVYSDGTPTTVAKAKMTFANSGYTPHATQEMIASQAVSAVKLSFTNKATGGTVLIDGTDVLYYTGLLRDAPLALPDAPGQ